MRLKKAGLLAMIPLFFVTVSLSAGDGGKSKGDRDKRDEGKGGRGDGGRGGNGG